MSRGGGSTGTSDQYEYFPDQRWKENTKEAYESPIVIDLHLAMFVMPNRTSVYDLCPNKTNPYEVLHNGFSTKQATNALRDYYADWVPLTKNINLNYCRFEDYNFVTVESLIETINAAQNALTTTTTTNASAPAAGPAAQGVVSGGVSLPSGRQLSASTAETDEDYDIIAAYANTEATDSGLQRTYVDADGETKTLHSKALVHINGKVIDLNEPSIQKHIRILREF